MSKPTPIILLSVIVAIFSSTFATTEIEEHTNEEFDKRASNLGSRMCRMDSRNCASFMMGKKFGRNSWLVSDDSRKRFETYLMDKLAAYVNRKKLEEMYINEFSKRFDGVLNNSDLEKYLTMFTT